MSESSVTGKVGKLRQHFHLIDSNMDLCIKYYAMWDVAWFDETLAEKLNDTASGTGLVTLRSMSSESLMNGIVRMFERKKEANRSVSLHFCLETLLQDDVLDYFVNLHLKDLKDIDEWIQIIDPLVEKQPVAKLNSMNPVNSQIQEKPLSSPIEEGREKEIGKEIFTKLKDRLNNLYEVFQNYSCDDDNADKEKLIQIVKTTRNKIVAHADLKRKIKKATHGDLRRAFFLAWEIVDILRLIIKKSLGNLENAHNNGQKKGIFSAYATAYCLLSCLEKENTTMLTAARQFGEDKMNKFNQQLHNFMKNDN